MIRAISNSRNPRSTFFHRVSLFAVMFVLLFGCLGYSAERPDAGDLDSPKEGQLALVWMDPHQLFPWSQERVAQEVQTVLADAGIEVSWRIYCTAEDLSPQSEEKSALPILLTPKDASTWGLENNVMGAVVGSGERRVVYIYFPNVKRAMGYSREEKVNRSPGDIYRFANALGRIIAHEVVHVCRPELPHTHDGLMAGRWNLKNLEYKRPQNMESSSGEGSPVQ